MSKEYDVSKFSIIIKADYQGSLTSVSESLNLIDTKGENNLRYSWQWRW